MAKSFMVTRNVGGRLTTERVDAWEFSVLYDGVAVFSTNQTKHTAFRDWVSIKQES